MFSPQQPQPFVMQAIASMQTEAAKSEIPLRALSSTGKSLPELPSPKLALVESPEYPRSSSESYDSTLHTATKAHFIRVEPATSLPLRVRVGKIGSNKIARRSVQITTCMVVMTTIYYGISLIPAFQAAMAAKGGLQLQIESESDSRQSVVYGFLQECGNRKVSIIIRLGTWY
jgi:hypothetical protein